MDYKATYYKIIENAKKETENGHRFVGYFEKHHILPKSLGGTNNKENLVKLTAREHFICHWLLVKMYDKGTAERNKMLCALWRMQSDSNGNRYKNSRAYEKLRNEFISYVKQANSIKQSGKLNSQYGMTWYTNRNTGESKKFKEIPDNTWIKGRNLFHGECCSIKQKIERHIQQKELAFNLWNQFKQGNFKSINEFSKTITYSQRYISGIFDKYISEYIGGKGNHKNNSWPGAGTGETTVP